MPPSEQLDTLVTVLDLVRSGISTRPEVIRRSGLGRKVVTQRLVQLGHAGLVTEGDLAPTTGGRAPRELQFHSDAGHVLVAELGATSISVGVADLAGRLLDQHEEGAEVPTRPDETLSRVAKLFDELMARRPAGGSPLWGIGIGVLGPVDWATGRPISLPTMTGWGDYPIRERFAEQYNVPVWVDNEVNLMALGELRNGLGQGERDLLFVKVGSGIGAGLISGGLLHRGASGSAGEAGHIIVAEDSQVRCWCGNSGCVAALASGSALAREGEAAAADGSSPYLATIRMGEHPRPIDAEDVVAAAAQADSAAAELITRSGQYVGKMLAGLVNAYNPALILIGGSVAAGAGDLILAAIRQVVYQRALPLATRNLRIALSPLSDRAGLVGAAFMVVDQLLSRKHLGRWIDNGTPSGRVDIIHASP
ncbi:ROK family protein [Nonomuraea insulae]|uniref:ROK family protein n=1 Tax=Nonomuraea insulae TaxID=1616787 RepID=A0ABW1CHE1_9ACTN